MLIGILSFCLVAAVVAIYVALKRAQGPKYHDISLAEIHPDLAGDQELLKDALEEFQRDPTKPVSG